MAVIKPAQDHQRRRSLRNLLWPDLSRIEVTEQDRALLPAMVLGMAMKAATGLALFAVLYLPFLLLTGPPLRYFVLSTMVFPAVLRLWFVALTIRLFMRIRSHPGDK